jgi:heterodisulfide reductase subunit A-like polyferredoxin
LRSSIQILQNYLRFIDEICLAMTNHPSQIRIVGAGVAGIDCSLSAAERGIEVVLLEQSNAIRGNVVNALIQTLGGLFEDQGEILNPG